VISTIQNVAAYDPATDLVTIARQGNERENTILSNQTNVIGRFAAGGLRHSVNASLEVARETQFAPALTGAGSRAPVDVYAPNPHDAIAGYAPARSGAFTRGETTTVALSAFDAVPIGGRLQINGGVRWEHYETAFRSVDAAGATTVDEMGRDSLVSGKVGVVARVARRGNVYASYGTSVTPPGGSNFSLSASPNNQNNPNVEPQLSSNLEAGTKWDVADGRLSLTGAVFHTVNENVLFTVDAAAVPPVFNQDDKQRVNGVSVGAAGEVMPGWNVLANAGYLDTGNLTQNEANAGKRLTLAPRYSGSVWSTYRLPRLPGTRGTLTVGGGVRATGKVFINAANTIEAPGYHLVDALVEYAVNEHLTLRLNVYNVTNERYIRNVNNNGGRYNPGYPRTAQFTSVVKF
jgi:catecholate siderophore receptor